MTKQTTTSTALQSLEQDHGISAGDVTLSGGGKGQKATTEFDGRIFLAKGTSRAQAVERLAELISIFIAEQDEIDSPDVDLDEIDPDLISEDVAPAKAKKARVTDEDAIAAIAALFPEADIEQVDGDDEDDLPGPVWDGETLVSIKMCVAECMDGQQDYCECKCNGANHGIAGAIFASAITEGAVLKSALEQVAPTVIGIKQCLCGCGGTTQRRFVPGHDARYHGLIKAQAYAAEHGLEYTDDDSLRAVVRKAKAADRRAAKKAAKDLAAAEAVMAEADPRTEDEILADEAKAAALTEADAA